MPSARVAMLGVLLFGSTASAQIWLAELSADYCDFDRALLYLDQAGPTERSSFDGRLLRARLLVQLDRGREALPELRRLSKAAPSQRAGDILLATALAQSSARALTDAEATLLLAAKHGVHRDLIDAGLAELRLSSGRTVEAESMLRKLLRRSPDMTGALMNLAHIRAVEGNPAEAAALIRLAWQLGYQNPRELRRDPVFAEARSLGLLGDLTSLPVGNCRAFSRPLSSRRAPAATPIVPPRPPARPCESRAARAPGPPTTSPGTACCPRRSPRATS